MPHRRDKLTEEANGKNEAADFFSRLGHIAVLGLIEWVPYLFESVEGEPMFPLAWNGLPAEKELYQTAAKAGRDLLTEGQREHHPGILVPVLSHIAEVQLIGVARLTYRPHTRMTGAWWAEHSRVCQRQTAIYRELCEQQKPASAVDGFD
jgi:hypothetical protein